VTREDAGTGARGAVAARPGNPPLRLPRPEPWALVATGVGALVPPVLWGLLLRGGALRELWADLVAILAVGLLVTLGAVVATRRSWERQLVGIRTERERPPETEVAARLLHALADYETRLAQALALHASARVQAEEADHFESEFARNLSHELRTPLNAILGFTHVLLDELDGPLTPDQREDVETIRSSGELLRDLVDDVLDLAALQSGQVGLQRATVAPEPVLREVARLLEGQRGGRSLDLVVAVEPGTPDLHVDPKRLRQILVNLGTNAVKFTDQGEVRFRAAPAESGGVRLTVEDTGSGIPREELPRLFDEFQQVSGAVRKGQGAGLGLAIVRRLTELHGGTVAAESTVGVGSAFHVVLPAVGEPEPPGEDDP